MFAEVMLTPGGVIAWLVVGLISGWLAGLFMRGYGFGMFADIIVGLIGAFVGGLVASMFIQGAAGFWGSIVISFLGACFCIAIVRALSPGPQRV
jgi:uncharacterized membrane protein YeaQ/YmgE (transglycosylase-associated protein family)